MQFCPFKHSSVLLQPVPNHGPHLPCAALSQSAQCRHQRHRPVSWFWYTASSCQIYPSVACFWFQLILIRLRLMDHSQICQSRYFWRLRGLWIPCKVSMLPELINLFTSTRSPPLRGQREEGSFGRHQVLKREEAQHGWSRASLCCQSYQAMLFGRYLC